MKVILASGSPRRRELLEQAGIEYEVCPADIEEATNEVEPYRVVEDLSRKKAMAVANSHKGETILAADTVVALDDKVLGKPRDEEHAFEMLSELSGRLHQVFTGVTIIYPDNTINTFSVCTDVRMYELTEKQIRDYIATKEPMDKAGAYGIQGRGALLIESIQGDYNNVVGLPLAIVYRNLYNK